MVVLCLLFVLLRSFMGNLYLMKYIMDRKFKQRYQQFHQQTDYLLWSQKKIITRPTYTVLQLQND